MGGGPAASVRGPQRGRGGGERAAGRRPREAGAEAFATDGSPVRRDAGLAVVTESCGMDAAVGRCPVEDNGSACYAVAKRRVVPSGVEICNVRGGRSSGAGGAPGAVKEGGSSHGGGVRTDASACVGGPSSVGVADVAAGRGVRAGGSIKSSMRAISSVIQADTASMIARRFVSSVGERSRDFAACRRASRKAASAARASEATAV